MQTFAASDVEISRKLLSPTSVEGSLRVRTGRPVEACASNLESLVQCPGHPFVQAAHFAFAEHLPLILSPDDVWLCIAQGFGTHVELNAEVFRDRFVAHR